MMHVGTFMCVKCIVAYFGPFLLLDFRHDSHISHAKDKLQASVKQPQFLTAYSYDLLRVYCEYAWRNNQVRKGQH